MTLGLDTALTGISGILAAPYDAAGDIASKKRIAIIDKAIAAAGHLPVVNGNTGDYPTANHLIAGMQAFEDIRAEELDGANGTGVKAALQAIGLDCGPTRPPSAWPRAETQQSRLQQFLSANNLIQGRSPPQ